MPCLASVPHRRLCSSRSTRWLANQLRRFLEPAPQAEAWEGICAATCQALANGSMSGEAARDLFNAIPIPLPSANNDTKSLIQAIRAFDAEDFKSKAWIASFRLDQNSGQSSQNMPTLRWQPFQYWSQGEQPEDVRAITELWNQLFDSIGIEPIRLFDKNAAAAYIEHHCPELCRAFSSAFHVAIESDVFRVAYAQHNNCIWLDSDLFPTGETKAVLENIVGKAGTTLLFRRHRPKITNAFFATPAHSDFFRLILNSTRGYDFLERARTPAEIMHSFGPGRFNATLDRMTDRQHLADLGFINEHQALSMGPPYPLAYKATPDAWQQVYL